MELIGLKGLVKDLTQLTKLGNDKGIIEKNIPDAGSYKDEASRIVEDIGVLNDNRFADWAKMPKANIKVFIAETGRYSTRYIKSILENLEVSMDKIGFVCINGFPVPKNVAEGINEKNDAKIREIIQTEGIIIPIFHKNTVENGKIKIPDVLVKIYNTIKPVNIAEIENPFENILVIEGKYVPIIAKGGTTKGHYLDNDGKLVPCTANIGLKIGQVNASLTAAIEASHRGGGGYIQTPVWSVVFYDITTKYFCDSLALETVLKNSMKNAHPKDSNVYKSLEIDAKNNLFINWLYNGPSRSEINDWLKPHFEAKGFKNFKISGKSIGIYNLSYYEVDLKSKQNVNVNKTRLVINAEVMYKNKHIIGDKSDNGGFVLISAEGDHRMVYSAWCQRSVRWAYDAGFCDQKYDWWDIVDWLSGPFAEKVNLKMDEFQFVHMGLKDGIQNKRKEILAQLKVAYK